ncbi:glycoside hydrolase family 30 protein [Halobacillus litoralis]|uniref:glycoside hydrolase family 30 protein n=1 Tax=Halobacillus litoralis TaxID=45668 RepID=UPI001CFE0915|nr:glycoside hydrolase family 30 protein [Halobacillus litoralis]
MKLIQTIKDTNDRLAEKEELSFTEEGSEGAPTLTILPEERYQTIMGFGGAFTEAAAYTLSQISEEQRMEVIESYYHPSKGLGYSLGRTHIHSCDFSLGNYTYVEDDDHELRTFSIEREHTYVIPMIKDARKVRGEDLTLLSSPWSPPAWMKTNREMNHGGQLLPEYREAWALYYAKYIQAMEESGIPIWGVTVQNEPDATQVWDSCRYSAEEERDFVRDYLGPTLEKEGFGDKKIVIWDHNRDIAYERARTVLSDPEAAKYVWGTGLHWYVSEEFENLTKIHNDFPDKHLIFTEGCIEGGVQLGAWSTGERYGRNIMGDLNNWLEGWIDWNLVLNEKGGPNHVGNYCDAPVIVDTHKNELHYNSSYYYIGHFSKYIKPNAVRIKHQLDHPSLQGVVFQNEDDSIVLVVMNETDKAEEVSIALNDKYCPVTFEAHSIYTLVI